LRDEVFAHTDTNTSAKQIIQWFVLRWGLEVTSEKARAHLGDEDAASRERERVGDRADVAPLAGSVFAADASVQPAPGRREDTGFDHR
jgi:hypothetical protein